MVSLLEKLGNHWHDIMITDPFVQQCKALITTLRLNYHSSVHLKQAKKAV